MYLPHGYILVLDPARRGIGTDHPLAAQFPYPVFVTDSAEKAVNKAMQVPPCLVIVVGDDVQDVGRKLTEQLRQAFQPADMTIVALTNAASPQWNHHDEIPGLDGLLVKPVSNEILNSLVESAFARHAKAGDI
jgi:DNA-binding NarL/FixJ family response regulator